MELGVFARVTPFVEHKVGCQLVQDLRGAYVTCMYEIEVYLFTNDTRVLRLGCADEIGCEFQYRIVVELGC